MMEGLAFAFCCLLGLILADWIGPLCCLILLLKLQRKERK